MHLDNQSERGNNQLVFYNYYHASTPPESKQKHDCFVLFMPKISIHSIRLINLLMKNGNNSLSPWNYSCHSYILAMSKDNRNCTEKNSWLCQWQVASSGMQRNTIGWNIHLIHTCASDNIPWLHSQYILKTCFFN